MLKCHSCNKDAKLYNHRYSHSVEGKKKSVKLTANIAGWFLNDNKLLCPKCYKEYNQYKKRFFLAG